MTSKRNAAKKVKLKDLKATKGGNAVKGGARNQK